MDVYYIHGDYWVTNDIHYCQRIAVGINRYLDDPTLSINIPGIS